MENDNDRLAVFIGFIAVVMSLSAFKEELVNMQVNLRYTTFSLKDFLVFTILYLAFALYLYIFAYTCNIYISKWYKFTSILKHISTIIVWVTSALPFILAVIFLLINAASVVIALISKYSVLNLVSLEKPISMLFSIIGAIAGIIAQLTLYFGKYQKNKKKLIAELNIQEDNRVSSFWYDDNYNAVCNLYNIVVTYMKDILVQNDIISIVDDISIVNTAMKYGDFTVEQKSQILEIQNLRYSSPNSIRLITQEQLDNLISNVNNITKMEVNMATQNNLEALKEAIEKKKPISFEYHAPDDSTPGIRYGNAHAVYIETNKSGPENVLVDLYQTRGVSKSGVIPNWKRFIVKHMINIRILEEEEIFRDAPGYNAGSQRYTRYIYKV